MNRRPNGTIGSDKRGLPLELAQFAGQLLDGRPLFVGGVNDLLGGVLGVGRAIPHRLQGCGQLLDGCGLLVSRS